MPPKSKAMQRFMGGCAHDPQHMKGKCPAPAIAREFARAPGGTTKGLPERVKKKGKR